ncbi:3-oxoacyl-[acyl-carrier-protein] reductase FabG-like [Brevipalpus obovatus]|uniref:3-oxoacyl-[acyl-carrier-protein] reductase FabG-like n=1 Tax=Brevipalpus obovatus TaxID=246614 RepID=UPI003D9E9D35
MEINLANKVALITGSSQGIGAATAVLFSKLGAKVIITGRKEDLLAKVGQECEQVSPSKEKPLIVKADLSKEDEVKKLADTTLAKYGGIDILVNNVGFGSSYNFDHPKFMEGYDAVHQLNVRSVVQLTNLLIASLKERQGTVINVSSVAGIRPFGFFMSYCMSKAALDMFTRCLAQDVAPHVRVNSLNPGPVETQFRENLLGGPPTVLSDPGRNTALGRVGTSDEMAKTIAFLASDAANNMTGSIVVSDGGSIITRPK